MSAPKSKLIPVTLLAVGIIGLWWWMADRTAKPPVPSPTVEMRKASGVSSPKESPVLSTFGHFREKPDRADAVRSLKDLQSMLKDMPSDQAVAWIRSFLSSGDDKPTGLSFVIGSGGDLTEWPTFRTFLIDQLQAIDPAAAASISREILGTPSTADEWALALRNVGKSESTPETNSYLASKTEELIANPAWQADPSIGYLNAFDVLVATNATASTPLLSSLIQRKDRKDLAHASFLTLDRLVQRQTVDELTRLTADSALQQSRPEMVSQQFARADLRDPVQREIVKNWMLDPARTPNELRSFAGVYPNSNRFISNNLLTVESQQSGQDLAAHDREALEIITAWSADPAFEPVKDHLHSMIARLNGFVGSPQPADE